MNALPNVQNTVNAVSAIDRERKHANPSALIGPAAAEVEMLKEHRQLIRWRPTFRSENQLDTPPVSDVAPMAPDEGRGLKPIQQYPAHRCRLAAAVFTL